VTSCVTTRIPPAACWRSRILDCFGGEGGLRGEMLEVCERVLVTSSAGEQLDELAVIRESG
jgi:hypothetical protein